MPICFLTWANHPIAGDEAVIEGSFAWNDIEDGTRLEVSYRLESSIEEVFSDLVHLNPHLDIQRLEVGASFDQDGGLKNLNLYDLGLLALARA